MLQYTRPTADTAPSIQHQEIERKWLLSELPSVASLKSFEIIQGYVAVDPNGSEVRLRQKGQLFFQTVKSDGKLARGEVEIELSKAQFDSLWATTEGRRVEKVRYEMSYNDLTIEIDVFHGSLSGLTVAEVEFPSEEAANSFTPPAWFGPEVTSDKAYRNKNLALNGMPHGYTSAETSLTQD